MVWRSSYTKTRFSTRRAFQKLRIADAFELGVDRRREIDGGLSPAKRLNAVEIEICVHLEANTQVRDSPNLALARLNLLPERRIGLFQGNPTGLELTFGLFEVLVDLSLVIQVKCDRAVEDSLS